jgi:hypothetical protein
VAILLKIYAHMTKRDDEAAAAMISSLTRNLS